jgi:hypothetical protein
MFRNLVKAAEIEIEGQRYGLRYYEQRTIRGARRFCCEIVIDSTDVIIIDDGLLTSLESKVARLAPAMVYSRLLAGRASAA